MITFLYKYVLAFKKTFEYNLAPSLVELLVKIYILDKRSFIIYELKDKVRQTGKRASLHEKLRALVEKGILSSEDGHTKTYKIK